MDFENEWKSKYPKEHSILNVRAEVTRHRNRFQKAADKTGEFLVNPIVVILLILAELLWCFFNLKFFPYKPFDPYPFTFLATIASCLSPPLALLILINQHRDFRIQELREEVLLQMIIHLEQEITMNMRLLKELQEKLSMKSKEDPEILNKMCTMVNPQEIMQNVRSQLEISGENKDKVGI